MGLHNSSLTLSPSMAISTSTEVPYPPVGVPVPMQKVVPWSTGLCDCFDDCGLCCITCWCPCITFGQIAEILDAGSTSCGASGAIYGLVLALTGCQWIYSCFYRTRMRSLYGLPEAPCPDCCVHFWCEGCALCQMYRELRNGGFDMNIGYHENMRRTGGGVINVPPPVPGGMYR